MADIQNLGRWARIDPTIAASGRDPAILGDRLSIATTPDSAQLSIAIDLYADLAIVYNS